MCPQWNSQLKRSHLSHDLDKRQFISLVSMVHRLWNISFHRNLNNFQGYSMISKPFISTNNSHIWHKTSTYLSNSRWSFIDLADFSLTYNKFYRYVVHLIKFYGFQLYFSIDLQIFSVLTRH